MPRVGASEFPAFPRELGAHRLRVTSAARDELARVFENRDGEAIGVRLYVMGAGCSGMRYAVTFADRQLDHDQVLRGDRFDIYVDCVAMSYLDGAQVDFEQRPGGDSFVFRDLYQLTDGSGLCGGCAGAIST